MFNVNDSSTSSSSMKSIPVIGLYSISLSSPIQIRKSGSRSLTVTLWATSGPLFMTSIVQVTTSLKSGFSSLTDLVTDKSHAGLTNIGSSSSLFVKSKS